jgi:hypothetical protein
MPATWDEKGKALGLSLMSSVWRAEVLGRPTRGSSSSRCPGFRWAPRRSALSREAAAQDSTRGGVIERFTKDMSSSLKDSVGPQAWQ